MASFGHGYFLPQCCHLHYCSQLRWLKLAPFLKPNRRYWLGTVYLLVLLHPTDLFVEDEDPVTSSAVLLCFGFFLFALNILEQGRYGPEFLGKLPQSNHPCLICFLSTYQSVSSIKAKLSRGVRVEEYTHKKSNFPFYPICLELPVCCRWEDVNLNTEHRFTTLHPYISCKVVGIAWSIKSIHLFYRNKTVRSGLCTRLLFSWKGTLKGIQINHKLCLQGPFCSAALQLSRLQVGCFAYFQPARSPVCIWKTADLSSFHRANNLWDNAIQFCLE